MNTSRVQEVVESNKDSDDMRRRSPKSHKVDMKCVELGDPILIAVRRTLDLKCK